LSNGSSGFFEASESANYQGVADFTWGRKRENDSNIPQSFKGGTGENPDYLKAVFLLEEDRGYEMCQSLPIRIAGEQSRTHNFRRTRQR
jgi:hypothetical protein